MSVETLDVNGILAEEPPHWRLWLGHLGTSRSLLGPSRGRLGAVFGHLCAILRHLWTISEPSWAILEPSSAILPVSCAILGRLEVIWDRLDPQNLKQLISFGCFDLWECLESMRHVFFVQVAVSKWSKTIVAPQYIQNKFIKKATTHKPVNKKIGSWGTPIRQIKNRVRIVEFNFFVYFSGRCSNIMIFQNK